MLLAPLTAGAQGVASLSGVVVAAGAAGPPIRGAYVTVTRLDSASRLSVVSDDEGRFSFAGLPAGRYMVSASKPAFLTTTLGSDRIGQPGTPLVLEAGDQVVDIRLALARGGVLAGTVRDMTGTPAANVEVLVAAAGTVGVGLATVRPLLESDDLFATRTVLTDDRGGYRIYGLPPGEYLIAALPGSESAPLGGDAAAPAGRTGLASGGPSRPHHGYAPAYFPGTPLADDATRVRVGAGEERTGLDFLFDLVPTASVSGLVSGVDGRPLSTVSLLPVGPPLPISSAMPRASRVTAEGQFEFQNVRPGRYLLRVSEVQTVTKGVIAGGGPAWAQTEVVVNGADVAGLSLVLQTAMSFSGRVRLDQPDAGVPNAELPPVRILMQRAGTGGGAATSPSVSGPALALLGDTSSPRSVVSAADGSFRIPIILPGTFSLTASPPAALAGWWLASATAGGRELLDMPLDFGTALGSIDDAVLTLTKRRTELTGRLQTPAGLPATDYSVIVFSADRAHWFPGARRTRAVRPASDGTFSVAQLPAGRYLVAAVTDVIDGEWQRASFLEQLAAFAVPVDVRAGETVRQDLQIAAGR